jgi:hypothetical protein
LRRLVQELRAEPPPELDWERMERELQARAEGDRLAARRARSGRGWPRWMGFAAAAAVLALVLVGQRAGAPVPVGEPPAVADVAGLPAVREAPEGLPQHLVGALRPASIVESGVEPVRFTLPGAVSWTLAPEGRVIVRTTSVPHELVLERGTVHAEVVPRHEGDALHESFVVEAGGTRVAVHGTVLSVERRGDRVVVEVTRGAVTVGPAGHRGVTTGHLLVGPARAAFWMADARLAERLAPSDGDGPDPDAVPVAGAERTAARAPDAALPSDPGGRSPAEARAARPGEATPPGAIGAARPPAAPSPDATVPPGEEIRAPEPAAPTRPRPLAINEAQAVLVACLSGESKPGDELRVIISSMITLTLDADRRVVSVRFAPPLKPGDQQRCAGALFGREIDAPASRPVSFRVVVSTR